MRAEDLEARGTIIRNTVQAVGEKLVAKLQRSTSPDAEWEKLIQKLGKIASLSDDPEWYCILPTGTNQLDCRGPMDPYDCLSLGGTPTTASCGNVAATTPFVRGQVAASVD
jgi:hypothetical protein